MKKLTSLLIGCSLALAGAALAQQPVEQQSPSKGKHAPEKARTTQTQPGANAAKPQERPSQQTGAVKGRGATNERSATALPGADRGEKTHVGHEPANAPKTNVPGKSTDQATKEPRAGKGRKAGTHEESGNAPATGTEASGHATGMPLQKGKEQQVQERKPGQGVKQPATGADATSVAGQKNVQPNAGAKAKKPEPQQVQQIKTQHDSKFFKPTHSRCARACRHAVQGRSLARPGSVHLALPMVAIAELRAGAIWHDQ